MWCWSRPCDRRRAGLRLGGGAAAQEGGAGHGAAHAGERGAQRPSRVRAAVPAMDRRPGQDRRRHGAAVQGGLEPAWRAQAAGSIDLGGGSVNDALSIGRRSARRGSRWRSPGRRIRLAHRPKRPAARPRPAESCAGRPRRISRSAPRRAPSFLRAACCAWSGRGRAWACTRFPRRCANTWSRRAARSAFRSRRKRPSCRSGRSNRSMGKRNAPTPSFGSTSPTWASARTRCP